MRRIAVVSSSMLGGLLLFGTTTAVGQEYFQPPTATELFNLRSRCAAIGQKMMEDNAIGSALTQSQTTHYSLGTNHCYVELYTTSIDGSDYVHRTLFDGQTGEMLA